MSSIRLSKEKNPKQNKITTQKTKITGVTVTDMVELLMLPENCIAHVLSFTGPLDACRLALVSSTFKSASESDTVWEKFLPSDLELILDISQLSLSKKELYFHLCQIPVLIHDNKLSFWLEKGTGKKCYMLSARALTIVWGDTPTYWSWSPNPQSRFGEIAELNFVCWLEIRGRIRMSLLSPNTIYRAYLVYRIKSTSYGLEYQDVEVNVGLDGNESEKRIVCLDYNSERRRLSQIVRRQSVSFGSRSFGFRYPLPAPTSELTESESVSDCSKERGKERKDGWLEIELGNIFNNDNEDRELEMSVLEVKGGHWKSGLIVQGLEIRPIDGK